MKTEAFDAHRRFFILKTIPCLIAGSAGFPGLIRTAMAMGALGHQQGMRKIEGDVKINGVPARIGDPVKTGDVVATGPDSMAVFVMDRSVYLVRENTHVEFSAQTAGQLEETLANVIRIVKGRMLSVFGRRRRRIFTPTAVVGIRGTGVYLEAEPQRTYVCTCYGVAQIAAGADPDVKETVQTAYHESPRFVYGRGAERLIVKAPVFNHTDEELIMLESLVFRKPPFVDQEGGNGY